MKASLFMIALLSPLPALAALGVPDKVGTAEKPQYITDVTGKEVRLVGPRFYADPARQIDAFHTNRTTTVRLNSE